MSLHQTRQDFGGNSLAETGVDFKQTRDIGQVFLALTGPARRIERSPHFSLKNILNAGNGQTKPKNVAHCGPPQKCFIAGIGLNLDPQVRTSGRDIETMGESFNAELLAKQLLRSRELVDGDDDIEVKAHNRLRIGVDALSAEDTISNPLLA